MFDKNTFCILGGDIRQKYLAEMLLDKNKKVYMCGFDKLKVNKNIIKLNFSEIKDICRSIIMPIPVTKDRNTLNAIYSSKKIILDDDFASLCRGHILFAGKASMLYPTSTLWDNMPIYDYSNYEGFAIKNAALTAEGAIALGIKNSIGSLCGSKCLITGYGRIGKQLAPRLKLLGADVTVSARKEYDLAFAEALGFKTVQNKNLINIKSYDLIFNTVPFEIFTKEILSTQNEYTVIIDLASLPGGIDDNAAETLNIKVIHALSLPSLYSPKAAAQIILDTVLDIVEV